HRAYRLSFPTRRSSDLRPVSWRGRSSHPDYFSNVSAPGLLSGVRRRRKQFRRNRRIRGDQFHVRERNPDAGGVEIRLDAPQVFALDAPLLAGRGLEARLEDDGGIRQAINADDLDVGENDPGEGRILAQRLAGFAHHVEGSGDVGAVVDREFEHRVAEALGAVGYDLCFAEGKDVQRAVEVAQLYGAEAHVFNDAAELAD